MMRHISLTKTQDINGDDGTSEHCDDLTLDLLEQQQTEELVEALAKYCRQLEKQVVKLRCQVNRLTPANQPKPFLELHSDLYECFCEYAAYPKFKRVLKCLR